MWQDACGCCERRGRFSVARLAGEYAPNRSLPTIMRAQIGDCPHRNARQEREQCDPYSPTLWPLFGGDSNARIKSRKRWGRQFARTGRPEHPNG
jgi:hypothetical protein